MHETLRNQLLREMLVELARKGHDEASLDDVIARAGVEPDQFAAQFDDLDGALFAAYSYGFEAIVEIAKRNAESEDQWPQRMRRGLEAILAEAAAKPELAKALTHSFPSISKAAHRHYVELLGRFRPCLAEGRQDGEYELPSEVETMAVGAAEAIIFDELQAGRAEQLPALLPQILFSLLVPFIGPDRACEEMRLAAESP